MNRKNYFGRLSRLLCLLAAFQAAPALGDAVIVEGPEAHALANQRGIPTRAELPNGRFIELQSFINDRPRYYITHNINAAKSTRSDVVREPAPIGFGLSGTGVKLGIWDGGAVLFGHQELALRAFRQDSATYNSVLGSAHATHVSGTMIAAGVISDAKGMSPSARLDCFDWFSDSAEMRLNASQGLRVSNHSYGFITGWLIICNPFNQPCAFDSCVPGFEHWFWIGDWTISRVEDANFGYYSDKAREWDLISVSNPRYLWCKAAGNDRGEGPPDANQDPFATYDVGLPMCQDTILGNFPTAPAPDGFHRPGTQLFGFDGYDCIENAGVGKNGLTVGAVNDVTSYTGPSSVVMSSFSCWGPTDDGRIKPDIVGNGVNVLSSVYEPPPAGSQAPPTNVYDVYSGTSMATPNVSGSLGLLIEHHRTTHPGAEDMLSSSLKALVLHTAEECGSAPGPDYRFGWGLLNTQRAAEVITQDAANPLVISESTVALCYPKVIYSLTSDGTSPELRATICWIDQPPSEDLIPAYPEQLNPSTKALVNDLDLRIFRETNNQEFRPWVLTRANPTAPAAKGDNVLDNVEQVVINNPPAGAYRLEVSSKGLFEGGSQTFSLVVTGASQIRREATPPLLDDISQPRFPQPGAVLGSLTSVNVTFTECAKNVKPADLLVNGKPAKFVSGSGAGPYKFSFDNPGNGPVEVQLLSTGIVDFADNPFPGASWSYRIKDCDGNRILDDEDIAAGRLEDCNINLVPDFCDPDVLKAQVGTDRSIAMNDEIELGEGLSAVGGVPPYNYEWTLRGHDGDEVSNEARPVFNPKNPGTYVVRLVVTDAKGCDSIAYLKIDVAGDGTTTPTPTPNPPTDAGGGTGSAGACGAGGALATLASIASLAGIRRARGRKRRM